MLGNIFQQGCQAFYRVDYVIKDIDGIKVGIFGLTMRITEILQSARNIEGLNFGPVEDAARAAVMAMRGQGVDLSLHSRIRALKRTKAGSCD